MVFYACLNPPWGVGVRVGVRVRLCDVFGHVWGHGCARACMVGEAAVVVAVELPPPQVHMDPYGGGALR